MGIMSLTEAATLGNPLGAASPKQLSTLLEILTLVKDIANSPLASTVAARIQGQGQTSRISAPITDIKPEPAQPGPGAPAPAPVDPEKLFMNYLASPQGRIKIANGLEQLKTTTGDITISQIIEILKKPNPEEVKDAPKS